MTVDPPDMEIVREAAPVDGEPVLMMPAEAYTSPEVLAWERRHLFAGSWSCLGRVDDLFPADAAAPGHAACAGRRRRRVPAGPRARRRSGCTPTPAGTAATSCCPRATTSERRSVVCPYHAWTYDLQGELIGARGFRDDETLRVRRARAGRAARAGLGGLGLRARPAPGWARAEVPSFEEHVGALDRPGRAVRPGELVVADRHTYEVAANWKAISENYHECYHCPLIHPELCQVSPPTSGDNYDLPGGWVGGSMDLRDGMRTMSLTGELAATPLPGAPPTQVEYLQLMPNLLVSAHPDYVMTHRMVPLSPDRTWVECSWLVAARRRRFGPRRGRCRGVLGPHQQAGLGGVRVGAARTGQPALRARAVRAQRGRRRAAGVDDRPGLPHRTAGPVSVRPVRRLTLLAVVVALAGTLLAVVGTQSAPAAPASAAERVQVGDLTLKPCKVVRRALCGSIRRAWEPGNPSAGKVTVGFAFVPARKQPAIDTLVPHEGGPGYSTTGTGADYAAMYGPLLDRRNLLLVDQRGTGLSRPLRCPDLQNLVLSYNVAAGKCGRSLGDRADDYTSTRSADDLAAVIAKLGLPSVSLYGDSYGTFFTQTFAGRHPELVRSIVLDSAYPTYGESAWYPTQSPAMRAAFTKACQRSPECRSAGRRFLPTLRAVLAQVRRAAVAGDGVRRRRPAGRGPRGRCRADQRRVRCDVRTGVLPGADRRAPLRPARLPRATAPAGRGGRRRREPTPGRPTTTARASTPRSPATTTRSSTT